MGWIKRENSELFAPSQYSLHLLRSFFEPPTGLIDKDIFANEEREVQSATITLKRIGEAGSDRRW